MKIIGVSGKMGCGKTTFAGHLIELLGPGWLRLSFADALKLEVARVFSFPVSWCYSEEGKKKIVSTITMYGGPRSRTVRDLLQWWGTDVRRAESPDYWVRAMRASIAALPPGMAGVVIDDVRFPDELAICDLAIRLAPYPGWAPGQNSSHRSETELDAIPAWFAEYSPKWGGVAQVAEDCLMDLNALGEI